MEAGPGGENKKNPLFFVQLSSSFPLTVVALLCVAVLVALRHPTPLPDLAFSVLFPSYLLAANSVRFNWNAAARKRGTGRANVPLVLHCIDETPAQTYVAVFAIVGLLLPGSILVGGPADLADAAAPHLYLLLCQVTAECAAESPRFHVLVRLLVFVGYSAYRTGALVRWTAGCWALARTAPAEDSVWYLGGFAIASLNLVMFSYNLFVFLLLRLVPCFLDPVECASPEVRWVGQLIPVIVNESDTATDKKRE